MVSGWEDHPTDVAWIEKTAFPSLWEVSADGTGLHPSACLDGICRQQKCCGNWTPDGKYYVFESTSNDKAEIWAIRDKHSLLELPCIALQVSRFN